MDYIQVDYDTKRLIIPGSYKTIGVQGDEKGRTLYFFIKNSPDTFSTSSSSLPTAYVAFKRPDGFAAKEQATITSSSGGMLVTYPVNRTLTECAGRVQIGVSLYKSSSEWRTASGVFYVEQFPIGAGTSSSDDMAYVNGVLASDAEVRAVVAAALS